MKKRSDFVTNSSSSSFILEKKKLTDEQLYAIREHSGFGEYLGLPNAEEAWRINENELFITGATSMDNYDIQILFDIIGVDCRYWGEYEISLPKSYDEFCEKFGKEDSYRVQTWIDKLEVYKRILQYRRERGWGEN